MKNTFFILVIAMAFAMVGCHNAQTAKTSSDDVKKAEAALFNSDMSTNPEAVPDAIAAFTKYVDDNPKAADAPEILFKAIEVSVNTKQDPGQSIGLVNKLVADYPKCDKNPVALFMLATFVYDDQLHNYDKARECYQRIVNDYPNTPFAKDAAISIEQLGMSPEELIRMFESEEKSEDSSQE